MINIQILRKLIFFITNVLIFLKSHFFSTYIDILKENKFATLKNGKDDSDLGTVYVEFHYFRSTPYFWSCIHLMLFSNITCTFNVK